jgi:uncharacterized protein YbbK (DUF523 family)
MMGKVAISACLIGHKCRYDGTDNHNKKLITALANMELIAFCPEDDAFGTPRPTMDLIATSKGVQAISNETSQDMTSAIVAYATDFFDTHTDISLFIGKDRSPSCGVCSAKVYDEEKYLVSSIASGIMAKEALRRNIPSLDAEDVKKSDIEKLKE